MIVEIDQSGKLEQLNTATAVAFSNKKSGVVWIRASIKRRIATQLRKRVKNRTLLWPMVFAAVIYILIDDLNPDVILIIDEEYTGKNKIIAETLSELLKNKFVDRGWVNIRFGRIGKNSSAHQLAWKVHRSKNRQRVRSLTENDILRCIK